MSLYDANITLNVEGVVVMVVTTSGHLGRHSPHAGRSNCTKPTLHPMAERCSAEKLNLELANYPLALCLAQSANGDMSLYDANITLTFRLKPASHGIYGGGVSYGGLRRNGE